MAKKRKKKGVQAKKMSPEKYIIQKGKDLEFYECHINEDWQEGGMAKVLISKKMPSGKLIASSYLLDIFCLGVKNTFYQFNIDEFDYEDIKKRVYPEDQIMKECDPVFIHNLIFGSVDYAYDLGFSPQKDFKITEYLLNPDFITDEINEIEFGKNGEPFFISGPDDNVNLIINKLNESVGEGNYKFMIGGPEQ